MNKKNIIQHIIKTFHTYAASSTFHCIKYIGMINLNIFERIFWFFAFSLFLALTCIVGYYLWEKFDKKPTIVKIEDINLAFTGVSFPAITICPANRIKMSLALTYLSRYLNLTNKEKIIGHIVSALSLLQFPTYFYMEYHLKQANKYLPLFDSLNITDFMIKTLPTCSEIMKECYWNGKPVNCCKIFFLQRTEEGFCYSFNSMLSENKFYCPTYVPSIMIFQDQIIENNNHNCKPMFTTASGIFSGLTVIMNEDISKDRINYNGTKYERGIVVMISTTYELPEAGTGTILETLPGELLQMEIKPIVMGSSRKLSNLPQDERGCRLRNDKSLWLYDLYTQSTCFIECRHKFVEKKCKCQLYFFYDRTSSNPPCTLNQLKCIVKLRNLINTKDLTSPYIDIPACKCTLPCYGILYDIQTRRSNLTAINGKLETGVLDVHFSSQGGIKYSKKLSFTDSQLTVAIGSVGNLFLGCSIISILEFLYYFIRTLIICKL